MKPPGVRGVGWAGYALTGLGVLAVAAHYLAFGWQPWIVLASAVPYLVLAALAGWAVLVAVRNWRAVTIASVVVLAGLATQLPLYRGAPAGAGRPVTMMTANLALGGADVRQHDVGVLTLQEQSRSEVGRLLAAGLDRLLPYHYTEVGENDADPAFGTGLWSRYPISDARTLPEFSFAAVTATVHFPAAGGYPAREVTVFAVHPAPPYPVPANRWLRELPALRRELAAVPAGRPVLVGGDFNSTWDNVPFRRLLRDGYRDATELSGAGTLLSYPVGSAVPPVIGIDHVLVRGIGARSVARLAVAGSDHRGLIARLVLPASRS